MGKKSPKAPDYTPMANASAEAARLGSEMGNRQLDESRRQYEENKPFLQGIANKQMAIMDQTMEQGEDYYNYNKETYRPLEKGIVDSANNFDTEGYREGLARSAVLDTQRAQAGAQQQQARAMAAMGINPNSGRFAGMSRASGLQNSAMRAGAATGARTQAEAMGYARKMDAAGLGRNLAGASTGAYQVATSAGDSSGRNQMAPGAAYMNGMGQGIGTMQKGQGLQLQGLGGILNAQSSYANANADQGGGLGALLGAGAQLGSAAMPYMMASDRRMKEDIVLTGKHDATGLNMYEFKYKYCLDPTRFRGVMADEVESYMPEAVVYDDMGFASVNYGMLGIEMVEV